MLVLAGARSSFGLHWVSGFLTSLTVTAVVAATWLAVLSTPAPGQLLWLAGLHAFALVPDLVGRVPDGHAGWANAFLAHNAAARIPGGNPRWWRSPFGDGDVRGTAVGVGLGAAGGDGARARTRGRDRGRRARPAANGRDHHAAGEPSVRASGSTTGDPAARPRGLTRGLADVIAELESREIAGAAPDLLGFGGSRRIGTRFALVDHVAALRATLEADDRQAPVVLVGHSFGCAVAVAFAAEHPERVSHLILVSPPVFRDADGARERLGQRGWLARQIVTGAPPGSVTCGLMCLGRPLAAAAAARLARNIPEQVARDSVEHSWPSYRDAVLALLDANPLADAIEHPVRPTSVIVSSADTEAPSEDVTEHPHDAVEVIELSGDHLVPLHHARTIAALTAEHIEAR